MVRIVVALVVLSSACDDGDEAPPPTWRGLAIGAACDGDGECGAGVVEATAVGGATCSTMPGASAAEATTEICDDLDNDCNGRVDDLAGAPAADLQDGACAGMMKKCLVAGGWIEPDYTLVDGYELDETTCDDRDNDCDGATDEGCPDCGAMDANGLFPNCDSCPSTDCDSISSPTVSGYACGCSAGCPCGLACGSIQIAAGVTVTACTR